MTAALRSFVVPAVLAKPEPAGSNPSRWLLWQTLSWGCSTELKDLDLEMHTRTSLCMNGAAERNVAFRIV